MEVEKIIDEWKEDQDKKVNIFGVNFYEITERSIKDLKERLIKSN